MTPELSHIKSSLHFPRLLIAENNFSTARSLMDTFAKERLDVDYDVCTSHNDAVIKLFRSPPPYHLVISSVRLAVTDDFLLLKHNRFRQPLVPFLITGGDSDKEPLRRALDEGAFDFIPTPLEHEQTVTTIRLALWHYKLKALIASRDKALDNYRQHMAAYPLDMKMDEAYQKMLAVLENTVSSVERSIHKIEASLVHVSAFVTSTVSHLKRQALARLDRLDK